MNPLIYRTEIQRVCLMAGLANKMVVVMVRPASQLEPYTVGKVELLDQIDLHEQTKIAIHGVIADTRDMPGNMGVNLPRQYKASGAGEQLGD